MRAGNACSFASEDAHSVAAITDFVHIHFIHFNRRWCILHSALCILHSALCTLHSALTYRACRPRRSRGHRGRQGGPRFQSSGPRSRWPPNVETLHATSSTPSPPSRGRGLKPLYGRGHPAPTTGRRSRPRRWTPGGTPVGRDFNRPAPDPLAAECRDVACNVSTPSPPSRGHGLKPLYGRGHPAPTTGRRSRPRRWTPSGTPCSRDFNRPAPEPVDAE